MSQDLAYRQLAGMIDIDPVKVRAWADSRNVDKFINSREKLEKGA